MNITPDPIALPELPTKWRKKPVVIEARQLVRHEAECIAKWCDGQWLSLYGRGDNGEDISHVLIPTLEGAMRAEIGDWIIKGVKGEFYPCKPDIFAATYEPAEAAPSTPPLNELLGQREEFNLNEVSGNPGQLASLEQRARELLADEFRRVGNHTSAERVLDTNGFRCMPASDPALRAITAALANQQGVGGAWLGTDIDSLRSIVLDETGCMVGLALYIASPNDGGPTIRQGRYDAAFGFVDSTTGRRIDVDAWSAPSRALTQPAGDVGSERE